MAATVDVEKCTGCGKCVEVFAAAVNGQLFVAETRCGPMVRAKLGVAEENSGKLVSLTQRIVPGRNRPRTWTCAIW